MTTRIKVNLADIENQGMVEPGKWKARLAEVTEEESRKGKQMLVWSWEILEGDSEGTTIKSYTSLQENALFGLKEHLVAFGAAPAADIDIDAGKLVGKEVILVVGTAEITTDSGDKRKVSRVTAVERISKAKKKAVVADGDANDEEQEASKKKPSAKTTSKKSASSDDDELPF